MEAARKWYDTTDMELKKFEYPRDFTVLPQMVTAVPRSALPTYRYMAQLQNYFLIVSPTAAWTSDDTPAQPMVDADFLTYYY
jgi:hypothetical protein